MVSTLIKLKVETKLLTLIKLTRLPRLQEGSTEDPGKAANKETSLLYPGNVYSGNSVDCHSVWGQGVLRVWLRVLLCHGVTVLQCDWECHSVTVLQCDWECYSVTVSQCHGVTVSQCDWVCYSVTVLQCDAVSRCHSVIVWQCDSVMQCNSVTVSQCNSVTM